MPNFPKDWRMIAAIVMVAASIAVAPAAVSAGPAVVSAGPAAVSAGPGTPGSLSAPEGGPVDDGWLAPGVSGPGAFSAFDGEAAPAGGPVWPGVRRDQRTTTLSDGRPVVVQILHLDPGAEVTVQPTLARSIVRGLAPVSVQSGDPLQGQVAATNGGFWLREPFGEPNGLFISDGHLVSNAESQGVGPRGTVGWTSDGRLLVDRINSVQTLTGPDGLELAVDAVNRGHREYDEIFPDGIHSLLAYTPEYGGPVEVTEPTQELPGRVGITVVRLRAETWPASGSLTGQVISIANAPGSFTPGDGEVIVVGTGTGADRLVALSEGDTVTLQTTLHALDPARDRDWAQVERALAGGPMIVKDSRMTAPGDWVDEGFEPNIHSDVRAPRTAIGVTADGRTLMVTADGRRPGITHGFTIAELAQYMIALGAVEAVSLDGGGSSQMVVDGILRNVPCCDTSIRSVATSLQVTHTDPFDSTNRLRGEGRIDTAAVIGRQAHPQGADRAVLAVADSFPDALAGGPLATALDGPLLLTGRDQIPGATRQVLTDLGVSDVVLLGGPSVIGPEVASDLADLGVTVGRIAGPSRIETAAAIAAAVTQLVEDSGEEVTRAFVIADNSFADALTAAAPGGILSMPILLNPRDHLHPATAAALEGLDQVVLVGGKAKLGPALEHEIRQIGPDVLRLSGNGRYGTAAAVNRWLADQTDLEDGLVVATGGDFPDALAGGPLAASMRVPLMIVPEGSIRADPDSSEFFDTLAGVQTIDVLGGLATISSYQQWELDSLAGRPLVEDCPLPLDLAC